jgi:formate-dependent phosphoribosylglycinamide formyltransferase (GAR transformylase)
MPGVLGKKLLIITASALQKVSILQAQRMGLKVVATDKDPNAPALKISDYPEVVDSLDLERMLGVARKHKVDGVVTEQTDVAVATAAYVAEEMGLPGIGYQVSLAATNKWLMRERCRAVGIPGPKYRKVRTLEEAVAAFEEIGVPVVIKPVDAQASRGVAKIWDVGEVPKWFSKAKSHSREGSVLVEEMMSGAELSVEAFVECGRVRVLGVCEKVKCPPPYSFDLRLLYPASFSEGTMNEILILNEKVIGAIGITMGLTHGEYIVTKRGVRLLELAARGCGARVITHLIPAMKGINPLEARIRQAVGAAPHLGEARVNKIGVLEFLMMPPGRIKSIEGLDEARRIQGVIYMGVKVRAGTTVPVAENGDGRQGCMLAVGESVAEVLAVVDQVKAKLKVEMETSEGTPS